MSAPIASTLNAAFGAKQRLEDQHVRAGCPLYVAHTLSAEGFDASEDGTGRGTPIIATLEEPKHVFCATDGQSNAAFAKDIANTLTSTNEPPYIAYGQDEWTADATPVCFDSKGTQVQTSETGASPPLRVMAHADSHQNAGGQLTVAIQERAVSENCDTGPDGVGVREDGASYTLEARATAQAVAFDMRGRDGGAQFEGPHETGNLRAASDGSSRSYVSERWAVRRLTPRECERLQGFPDDYTAIPWRGKPAEECPDGHRYKALGNSWAVNVFRWVGHRINVVERLISEGAI